MAQEKLTLLLDMYKDNPKALLKIEEYLENQYYKKPCEKRREKYFQRLATIEKIKRKEKQQRDE